MIKSLFGRKKKKLTGATSLAEGVKDAVVGDVFTIMGFDVEYDDGYYLIEAKHRYATSYSTWYELVAGDGDRRLWVYWSNDGGQLFTSVTNDNEPIPARCAQPHARRPYSGRPRALSEQLLHVRGARFLLSQQRRGILLRWRPGGRDRVLYVGLDELGRAHDPVHRQIQRPTVRVLLQQRDFTGEHYRVQAVTGQPF